MHEGGYYVHELLLQNIKLFCEQLATELVALRHDWKARSNKQYCIFKRTSMWCQTHPLYSLVTWPQSKLGPPVTSFS
ncbi:Hypothetical predicted protein [Podarcis lilfordi]|uniref:Uncharacterized protein n=1 Tax=Podarcis lilfordi TaxID=74358 RepID=A0AA35K5V0_9SAUR|nr:Hypothetical predicted protein [Podarcis lilfordi]